MTIKPYLFVLSFALCISTFAQKGDRKGHNMVENWKKMNVPAAPSLSPEEAMKSFKIAPGFKLELVASDPILENPVAMTWDGDGRIWVVEMRAYMQNVDGKGEEQAKTGRISVLEDTNADGKVDKHTVFLDGLIMPRAISIVKGGVLVAEPPNLWYCQDTNGDLVCDKKEKVADYARQGPVEHTDNGLVHALDNWMYNAKSKNRHKFVNGKLIQEASKFRGQWGINQDNYGRLYYTTNSNYLHYDWEIYSQKYKASLDDKSINSIRINPGINRGYQGNMLKKDHRLARVTAISGPGIYRGEVYGKSYINGAFIPEPSANAIAYFEYSESSDTSVKFKHKLYDDPKWTKREFLTSTDERFRPVSVYTGPDGCIYFIDLYHGILQHKVYVTTYLRKQVLERGLDKGNQKGRIYRIVPTDKKVSYSSPKLQNLKPAELVKYLGHANGWHRDTAQRLLVQHADKSVAPAIEALIKSGNQLAKIHGLWTLEGIGALNPAILAAAASDSDSKVKLTAAVLMKGPRQTTQETYASNRKKLSKKDQKMYDKGKDLYNITCFGCHQPNGKGLAMLAPPLAGSEWVTKKHDDILIKIALHGITGPIKVMGKQYDKLPVMPGHAPAMDDEKIAAVLTYVRNTWVNKGKAVSKDAVKTLRQKHKSRQLPWTVKELEN